MTGLHPAFKLVGLPDHAEAGRSTTHAGDTRRRTPVSSLDDPHDAPQQNTRCKAVVLAS